MIRCKLRLTAMSWSIHLELDIPPRVYGLDRFEAELTRKATCIKSDVQEHCAASETIGRYKEQVDTAVKAAIDLYRRTETAFPTGCKVTLWLDGHVDSETLNYGNRLVGLRLFVQPVPFHR